MITMRRAGGSGYIAMGFVLLWSCVLLCAAAGCGGGSSSGGGNSGSTILTTPSVTVTPASSNVTTAQTLAVTITVVGNGGMAPGGTVSLSSGSYGSFAATLSSGSAGVTVPAGLLALGSDTLTASYTPGSTSSAQYNSASGTAMVTVSGGPAAPTVTATSVTYPTAGPPFQALPLSSGGVLVSVGGAGVQVFSPGAGGLVATCVNALPSALVSEGASSSNLSLLPNGTDVAVGVGTPGALFLNLAQLQSCTASGAVVSQGSLTADEGSQEVAVTPDGKYAFVSNEYGVAAGATTEGNIGVVALAYDTSGNVTTGSTLLGQISTGGNAIAGMALSPDGSRLYVTTEIKSASLAAAGSSNPILARTGCVQQVGGAGNINGTLTVIDVAKAESSPGASAVVTTVDAGCSPVRMAETADGSTLWVAVRGDNRVLAFSTGMLETNAGNALLGYADTGGTAPVGVRLFHNGQLLAVANSNRFGAGVVNATVLYVAVPATASVVQTIATGLFPREIRVGADDGTLYLTNYDSETLQVISTMVQ